MSKTNDLKKLMVLKLNNISAIKKKIYFENATPNAGYPHAVYTFKNVSLDSIDRDDIIVEVDIWDKSESTNLVDDISDDVEQELSFLNEPTTINLPTIYKTGRASIPDDDKSIKHRRLSFLLQNYERNTD